MMLRITRLKNQLITLSACMLIAACSSQPVVDETKPPPKIVPKNNVLEEVNESDSGKTALMETTQDPTYAQLMQLLSSLGYEGVGLQFESQDRLNLLIQVFSNPKAAYRNLRLVYTGTQWNYDLKHQSLTVGEGKDAAQVVQFIEKHIKLKPVSQRKPIVKKTPVAPPPVQSSFPKKLPVDVTNKLKKQIPEPAPSPMENATDSIVKSTPAPTPSETPQAKEEAVHESAPVETPESSPSEKVVETPTPEPSSEEKISPFQNDAPEASPEAKPESTLDENQPM